MKISKTRLTEIIKEELEQPVFVIAWRWSATTGTLDYGICGT